jgi:hypothetical protein
MISFKHVLGAAALVAMSSTASADRLAGAADGGTLEVTITNVSKLQFTPLLVATHTSDVAFFQPGAPASDELAMMAEGGDIGPLAGVLEGLPNFVGDIGSTDGLLFPGQSVTVELDASRQFDRLSVAAMLLPTNDAFVAINSVPVPRILNRASRFVANGYDAGSEPNDELCANIPGPTCGGAGASPNEGGEGYVSISAGIQGVGDVSAATYDWRNPVAIVTVRRVSN